jgi:hypothetical protein
MSKTNNYQTSPVRSDNLKDALRELDERSQRDPKWKALLSRMSPSELREIAPGYASITMAEWLASLALPPKRVEGNWVRADGDLSDPPIDLERGWKNHG